MTVMGASALAFSATNASAADIACTGDVCWHTHRAYEYPPEAHVIIHPNHWALGELAIILLRVSIAAAIGLATLGRFLIPSERRSPQPGAAPTPRFNRESDTGAAIS
jgi:hypothetical protein